MTEKEQIKFLAIQSTMKIIKKSDMFDAYEQYKRTRKELHMIK